MNDVFTGINTPIAENIRALSHTRSDVRRLYSRVIEEEAKFGLHIFTIQKWINCTETKNMIDFITLSGPLYFSSRVRYHQKFMQKIISQHESSHLMGGASDTISTGTEAT